MVAILDRVEIARQPFTKLGNPIEFICLTPNSIGKTVEEFLTIIMAQNLLIELQGGFVIWANMNVADHASASYVYKVHTLSESAIACNVDVNFSSADLSNPFSDCLCLSTHFLIRWDLFRARFVEISFRQRF